MAALAATRPLPQIPGVPVPDPEVAAAEPIKAERPNLSGPQPPPMPLGVNPQGFEIEVWTHPLVGGFWREIPNVQNFDISLPISHNLDWSDTDPERPRWINPRYTAEVEIQTVGFPIRGVSADPYWVRLYTANSTLTMRGYFSFMQKVQDPPPPWVRRVIDMHPEQEPELMPPPRVYYTFEAQGKPLLELL